MRKFIYLLATLGLLSFAAPACGEQDGPLENAAENIEEAGDELTE